MEHAASVRLPALQAIRVLRRVRVFRLTAVPNGPRVQSNAQPDQPAVGARLGVKRLWLRPKATPRDLCPAGSITGPVGALNRKDAKENSCSVRGEARRVAGTRGQVVQSSILPHITHERATNATKLNFEPPDPGLCGNPQDSGEDTDAFGLSLRIGAEIQPAFIPAFRSFNPKPGTDRRLVRWRFSGNSRHSGETRTPSACG